MKLRHYLKKHSPFIMGGASLSGDGGGYSFGAAEDGLVEAVWERGIRIFDSAPIYGFGHSEIALGKALKSKSDDAYIISKSGIDWHENMRVNLTNDPKVVHKMLDESLTRLKRDYIDLYMVHWPDEKVDIRHTMEAMARAFDKQKVLEVGLCNTSIDEIRLASEIMPISAVQCQHNCFEGPDTEFRAYLKEQNIPFMGWGVFDKGILTGRVDKKREKSKNYEKLDARKKSPWWIQSEVLKKIEKVELLKSIAEKEELTLLELALSYVQTQDWHSFSLIGSKNIKDWQNVLEAKTKVLSEELVETIEELCQK